MKKYKIALLASGVALSAVGAYKFKKFREMDFQQRCTKCSSKFVGAIGKLHKGLPTPPTDDISNESYNTCSRQYMSKAPKKAHWSLGYAQISILPEDITTKKYCIAGNTRLPANFAAGVLDDVRVRTIAVDDNTGRGAVVFCSVDCIGISNKNVQKIRELLKDFIEEKNISYINISSTHTHSGIDTMGIWGEIIDVLSNNRRVLKTGEGQLKNSCDDEYMEFLFEAVIKSIKQAVNSMEPGKLYESYMGKSSMQGMDENSPLSQRGLYGFVWDRREPYDCSTQLLRLRFVPDNKAHKQTVVLSFGAHPYINSMKEKGKGNGDMISGDFVYSLGDFFERNNYNFVYFNGPVAAVYPTRLYSNRVDLATQAKAVGEEIGRISLAMTMEKAEIEKNPAVNPGAYESYMGIFSAGQQSSYAKWVESKGEQVIEEAELKPLLNLTVKRADLQVDNPIFYAIAKHRIGSYTILPGEGDKYTSYTEVGLLELGGCRKIALVPGELEPAVLSGSQAVGGEESFSKTSFSATPLKDSAKDEELMVFGLTNDAIGYIIPDNDFSMMFLGTGKLMKELFGNHYLEIFSFGKFTAASIADTFKDICQSITDVKE